MAGTALDRAKPVVVVAAIALLTAALGVAASARVARHAQSPGQDPGAVAGQQGPDEQQGPGRMKPGPGMRGGPGGPGGFGGPGGMMGRMPGGMLGGPFGMLGVNLRAAELTEAQQKQVQAVVQSHREEQAAIAERMRAARAALQDAVAADAFDEAVIRAKAADVAAIEADAAVLQAKVRAEVLALLTPEQAQKVKDAPSRMRKDSPRQGGGRLQAPRKDVQEPAPKADEAPSLPVTV